MENFLLSANAVLPMFLLLAAGFLSRKAGVLTREDAPRFNKVAFRIFLPCLLFYNIYCSDLSAVVKPGLIIYAVCGVLLVFFAAFLSVQRLVPREDWKGVIAQGIFRSNFVIMGIPIAQALVGPDQLGAVTVLIAVVVPLFNFLSVYVLERFRGGNVHYGQVFLEVVKNPLIVSSLLGIAFQLLGIRLPKLLEQTVSSLSVIASPLQLFLLGAFFRFDGLGRYARPLAAVTVVKLFVTPAVLLGTAALLGRGFCRTDRNLCLPDGGQFLHDGAADELRGRGTGRGHRGHDFRGEYPELLPVDSALQNPRGLLMSHGRGPYSVKTLSRNALWKTYVINSITDLRTEIRTGALPRDSGKAPARISVR